MQTLVWFLAIEVMGIIVFPITFRLLPILKDKGFSIAKPFSMVALGLLSWLLSTTGLLAPNTYVLYLLFLFIACLSIWSACKQLAPIRRFIKLEWKTLIAAETIYIVVFASFALIRYFDPAIDHTEQPMDFAFLTSSMHAEASGALDPWMKGLGISYYYFGYWIFGNLGNFTFSDPEIAYNLAMATIPALLSLTIFGLSLNLIPAGIKWFVPIVFAAFSAIVSVFLSNFYGVLAFMKHNALGSDGFWQTICIDGMKANVDTVVDSWRPTEFWWWFKSTRIINFFGEQCNSIGLDYTITEFPFFSYLLGDMHPHVMSAPFIVMFLIICLNIVRKESTSKLDTGSLAPVFMAGLTIAAVTFMNMWTLPTLIAVLTASLGIRKILGYEKRILPILAILIGTLCFSAILLLPYLMHFSTSVSGLYPSPIQTGLTHGITFWGPLFIVLVPYVVWEFAQSKIFCRWKTILSVGTLIATGPWLIRYSLSNSFADNGPGMIGFALPLTILILISAIAATSRATSEQFSGKVATLYLLSLGFLLILLPELIYVGDVYDSRMNTIFKLSYQGWVLLSLCTGYVAYFWFTKVRSSVGKVRVAHRIWGLTSIVALLLGLYYAPAAAFTKASESPYQSRNGLIFLRSQDPGMYEAINFARQNIDSGEGILESVGEWGTAGIIAGSTGLTNIVNWPGHQQQWRKDSLEIDKRTEDVRTIYLTENATLAKSLLGLYEVRYILVSQKEIRAYGIEGMKKFENIGKRIYGGPEGLRIYKVDE